MDADIKIFQAFHKPFVTPRHTNWITPITVGSFIDHTFLSDQINESISSLNPFYCELTALYWIWKNSNNSYVGLYHYRRYLSFLPHETTAKHINAFSVTPSEHNIQYLSSDSQLDALNLKLKFFEIIIPRRFPCFPSVSEDYLAQHEKEPWLAFLEEVKLYFPFSTPPEIYFSIVDRSPLCNVFATRKSIFDSYCADLFTVLDRVFQKVGPKFSEANSNRYPGFLAERFLGYWIYIKRLNFCEVPMILIQ